MSLAERIFMQFFFISNGYCYYFILNAEILPPPTAVPTEPPTTPTEKSNTTTVAVPVGTEKRTGGLGEDQMIIIIVCVGLIVLFLLIAAVYFLGFRRWREQKGMNCFFLFKQLPLLKNLMQQLYKNTEKADYQGSFFQQPFLCFLCLCTSLGLTILKI